MKKIYYEKETGNFYTVKQTEKTITIEWDNRFNCDGSLLDQNVKYKKLVIRKIKPKPHCLSKNDSEGICIYPFQCGIPFFLEPAKKEHIDFEISDCKKWGCSSKYYKDLLIKYNLQ